MKTNLKIFLKNIKNNLFTKNDIISFNILEYRQKSTIGYITINSNNFFFKIIKSKDFVQQYKNYLNAKKNTYTPILYLKYQDNFYSIFIYEIINRKVFLDYMIDNKNLNMLEHLSKEFFNLYKKYKKSLVVLKKQGENDIFFIERLSLEGRINSFYINNKFNFNSFSLSWNEIQKYKFCIDGILYEESFFEIIEKAKRVCSPSTKRVFWNSHGDIIETNIYFHNTQFGFIDTETYGENWALSDIIIPLIAFGFMFNYTIPVYQKNIHKPLHKVNIKKDSKNKIIIIDNVNNFNTDDFRKKIIKIIINNFAKPLLNDLKEKEHLCDYTIDEQIKSIVFMRLFAVHNIQKWNYHDQAKIFGYIYKIVGTPINEKINYSVALKLFNLFD